MLKLRNLNDQLARKIIVKSVEEDPGWKTFFVVDLYPFFGLDYINLDHMKELMRLTLNHGARKWRVINYEWKAWGEWRRPQNIKLTVEETGTQTSAF